MATQAESFGACCGRACCPVDVESVVEGKVKVVEGGGATNVDVIEADSRSGFEFDVVFEYGVGFENEDEAEDEDEDDELEDEDIVPVVGRVVEICSVACFRSRGSSDRHLVMMKVSPGVRRWSSSSFTSGIVAAKATQ